MQMPIDSRRQLQHSQEKQKQNTEKQKQAKIFSIGV